MTWFGYPHAPRYLCLAIIAGAVVASGTISATAETAPAENLDQPAAAVIQPGSVSLSVRGESAGVAPEYFEQTLSEAIIANGVFASIDKGEQTRITMPMIGASSTFSVTEKSPTAQYWLEVRIVRVETPSFSTRMTVDMKVAWTLYRNVGEAQLFREIIESNYTGGFLEGGIIGADRVRVAMEGAIRENIRIGTEKLKALNLEQEQ